MSTRKEDAKNQIIKIEESGHDIDQYTTQVCLTKTIGEVVLARDRATNAKQHFVADIIFSAVFEMDMGLIEVIATRIDGTVPTSSTRDSFANLMGDALDDVLDMDVDERIKIQPTDPVIIAIAKAIFHIATCHPNSKDLGKKRDRQKAVEMVYARTAGRRNEPVRLAIEQKFVEPEWLREINEV